MQKILCLAFVGLVAVQHAGPAQAQSAAAAQVCADILAQYGIAPEGCDPQDDFQKQEERKPEVNAVVPQPATAAVYSEQRVGRE